MNQKHQEDLSHIRSMMERSSRFISLSGLSGVFAGLSALIGGLYVCQLLEQNGINYFEASSKEFSLSLIYELITTGVVIFVFAFFFGIVFTVRKSRKDNLPIWTSSTKNMLIHLAIPLVVGGVFCLALLYHQMAVLIAPLLCCFMV